MDAGAAVTQASAGDSGSAATTAASHSPRHREILPGRNHAVLVQKTQLERAHLVPRLYQAQRGFGAEMSRLDDVGFAARHGVFLQKRQKKGLFDVYSLISDEQDAF